MMRSSISAVARGARPVGGGHTGERADGFKRIVETFLPTGINEFVVMWPGDDRRALIEHAAEVMTVLRAA